MPLPFLSIVRRSPLARARSRTLARALCAASALLLATACKGRDAAESRTAAAAAADRRARRSGAPAATLPAPVVLPDSESLATLTPQRVNARASRPVLGGEGATVLRAQILLDQAGFSSGALDGAWGGSTSKAAFWYQEANDLPVTGFIDAATFASRTRAAGNRPAVARYTATPAAGDSAPSRAIAQPAVARIVISKTGSYLQALDAGGRVLAHFPSTLGSTYDPRCRTRAPMPT